MVTDMVELRKFISVRPAGGLSGFVGQVKRGEGDLLILRWLFAKLRRRTGEGLLNLKDLLTVFSPSLKRLFLFLMQNLTEFYHFLSKTRMNTAENSSFSRPILLNGGRS